MPEYLAPGVYVEETSFRSKSIEGVSTTTTGFVGPTRYGPVNMEPDVLTSLADFERVYGGGEQLQFTKTGTQELEPKSHNYMWQAARAFFENGGKRLYVSRIVGDGDKAAKSALLLKPSVVSATGDGAKTKFTFELTADVCVASIRGESAIEVLDEQIAVGDGTKVAFEWAFTRKPLEDKVSVKWEAAAAETLEITDLSAGTKPAANATIDRGKGLLRLDAADKVPASGKKITVSYFAKAPRSIQEKDGKLELIGGGMGDSVAIKDGKLEISFAEPPAKTERWTINYGVIDTATPPGAHARFGGRGGNGTLRFAARSGPHLGSDQAALDSLFADDIVEVQHEDWVQPEWRRVKVDGGVKKFERLKHVPRLRDKAGAEIAVLVEAKADEFRRIARAASITVAWTVNGDREPSGVWDDIKPPTVDGIAKLFTASPESAERARTLPVVATAFPSEQLFGGAIEFGTGTDGGMPTATDYEGRVDPANDQRTGLKQFEDVEDISIVAAPAMGGFDDTNESLGIAGVLKAHVERMRYRVAVLDTRDEQSIGEVRSFRAQLDSTHMALYYPWIRVKDPITKRDINLPPSGFVTGIYARNDVNRAVYKAPANEVVNLALGFERTINRSQQEVLNPDGINCLRFFENRGMRVWGARTISSDPEWKYVNVRRYFAYLERSIDRGTQWAVFEPNGENLWRNVRRTIEDFLLNEFMSGALLGDKPEKAFFVRCDRSTMTQNDLDNGRLVCLIGVAPLKPAEFVIFRIGQWTADAKN